MHAIHEGKMHINDIDVNTFERIIATGKTRLSAGAGTTGYTWSDNRTAGGRTYPRLIFLSGDICFNPIRNKGGRITGIEIASCGDDGLNAIMMALDFMNKELHMRWRIRSPGSLIWKKKSTRMLTG